ncbi:RNA polymerase sigma factor [Agromyces italicus]|uniref:RNA polymerase sigma factor n=1 Tax=Agromyces italicus TaxID=279572 RepID=UPI0003B6B6E8|nr:sigma-70 family RNA polymerase sigma factor [Agromyces italicus]
MSTDRDIIARSLESPAAFSELYDRHAPRVHRFAARRVGSHAADDVMSETFLVAFERRGRFDGSRDDAMPWLYGIATTLLKKRARLEARAWRGLAAAHAATEPHLDATDAVGDRIDAEAALGRLGRVIARMPRAERDTLLLYALGDLDYSGVAEALEVPIGTVRSRLNRARRRLRIELDAGEPRESEVEHERAATAAPII